jgi:hypothetical protein
VSAKRLAAALVALAGATAFTVCLLAVVGGMRDVAQTDGGFCASGGPYVIARQCSNSDVRLIVIGIFGALLAAGFYAGGTDGLGSRAASAGLLLWAALFGTLGWTFLSAGHHSGLFTGVLFVAMAAGGLILLLVRLADDRRGPSRPDPLHTGMQPLVRATVPSVPGMPPGMIGFRPAAAPVTGTLPVPGRERRAASRSTEVVATGVWLLLSAAGTALGIALSSSLISVVR